MRKFPIKAIIAPILLLLGLVACFIFVMPSYPSETKIVEKYISAINQENEEKMKKCIVSAADVLGDAWSELEDEIGDELGELEDYYDEYVEEETTETSKDKKADLLDASVLYVSLPEDLGKIESIQMVGCSKEEAQTEYGITGIPVNVLLEIKYTTNEKEADTRTIYTASELVVIKSKKGYRIAGL